MTDTTPDTKLARAPHAAPHPPLAPWYGPALRVHEEPVVVEGGFEHLAISGDLHDLRAASEEAWRTGDLTTAVQNIKRAIEAYRHSGDEWGLADALALRGAIARTAGQLSMAAENYREALSAFNVLSDLSSTMRLFTALAEARFATGDYAAAADLHRQALSLLPDDLLSLTGLAYAEWQAGHVADALTFLSHALAVGGESAVVLSARGQIQADLSRSGPALADLDRALALGLAAADEVDLRSARALALALLDRRPESDTERAEAVRLDPDRALTHLRIARIALHHGDERSALTLLRKALKAAPPLPPVHAREAQRLLRQLTAATTAR